jgi:hypothetical protein
VSDHTPLVLDAGLNLPPPPKLFRFQKWWLQHDEFSTLVHKVWNSPCGFSSAIGIWQFKLRSLRKAAKGWGINIEAAQKKKESSYARV